MSIKQKYTILCDDVRREDNGKFIIIGGYFQNTMTVPQVPFIMPSLTLFQILESDRPGMWNIRVKLQHLESGRNIVEAMGAMNFQRPGEGINALRLANVPLIAPGAYNIVMEIENTEPIIIPFNVVLNIPQSPQMMPPGIMQR